ncbi:MAG: hypothetical protein BAJALOKI2v1_590019 [Promethearchaeota archaeon]|nr:MAG: hypothetical protein BAJALOKI2v1_590019 [Candidatus Lokiarchaeota archaeon]
MDFTDKYIDVKIGNIPLIFSVPHGGTLDCKVIPNRKMGVVGVDKNTVELTMGIINEIKHHRNSKINSKMNPSYIISKIQRKKIDFNRAEIKAFSKNSKKAHQLYQYYHRSIEDLILMNLNQFNSSLLIDIHGFEQKNIPNGYRQVDIVLGTNNLKTLYPYKIPKRKYDKNIRGNLIKEFLREDFQIAPGHPKRKEYVLKGGYITKKYGASRFHNSSQTIQIEFSDKVRMKDISLKRKVIKVIAQIFSKFIKVNI